MLGKGKEMEIRDTGCIHDINVFHITKLSYSDKNRFIIFTFINGGDLCLLDKTEIDFISYKVQIAEEKAKIMGGAKGA